MINKKSNLKSLEKKRPLWRDLLSTALTVTIVWGGTHLSLNYSAYASLAEFQYKDLKASVITDIETMRKEKLEETLSSYDKMKLASVQKERSLPKISTLKSANPAKDIIKKMEIYPSDNRLIIPRIGKNVPLVTVPDHNSWEQLENNIQKGLQNGVVVHPISREPGSFGNFFITGHSSYYAWDNGRFKDVFALLHEVEIGDIVEIYWEGKQYAYKIREEKVVLPTQVDVLNQPKDKSILTLMTCTPVGTNKKRLILVADPIT